MAYVLFIALGFVLTFFSWVRPSYARVLGAVFLICAVAFAGFRGNSMDYGQYVIMFGNIASSTLSYPAKLYVGKDPLFGALIIGIESLGMKSQWLFMFGAALALILKSRAFIRIFGSFLTPLFVTVCLTYFVHEFTQIRVAIALGFAFMALVELCYGRKRLWTVYSAFAIGFHISTAVLLVLELPLVIGINRDRWFAVWGLGILLVTAAMGNFLSILSGVEDRAAVYIGVGDVSSNALIVAIFKLAILTILTKLILSQELDLQKSRLFKLCYLFEIVGFGFFIIFMDKSSGLGFRIYEMLDAFSVFIVAAALLKKTTLRWGVAMSYCAALLIVLSVSKLLLPYQLARSISW